MNSYLSFRRKSMWSVALVVVTSACGGGQQADTTNAQTASAADEVPTMRAMAATSSEATTLVGVGSGKCLGIKGNSADDRAAVQIQGCSGASFQAWALQTGSNGSYTLKNAGSGKCLDVPAATKASGVRLVQYACNGAANQQWGLEAKSSNRYAIVSKSSGLALDVEAGSTANGAYVQQWGFANSDNQLWTLGNGGSASTDSCQIGYKDKPTGFAQQGGTVGGGDATPVQVTTAAQLTKLLSDDQPRVLHLMNDLDFRTARRGGVQTCNERVKCDNGSGVKIEEPRVSATCDAHEYASTSYRYETTVKVGSNKTVIGVGPSGKGVTVYGASFRIGSSRQVIFRNLRVTDVNPHLVEAGDGFTLSGAANVWLDHIALDMISDGFVDIAGSQNVTLSWVHFQGKIPYQCGGQHHFVSMVQASTATYSNSWFDHTDGRNPKIGDEGSRVHIYNNYWKDVTQYAITAQHDAEARVESNYFENANKPHWLQKDGNGQAGIAVDGRNVYTGVSSKTNRDVGGSVFAVPYRYTTTTADAAKAAVSQCVGPQSIR